MIWFLLWATPVWSLDPQTRLRDYAQDRWGVEEGLPQLTVLSITEDALGYLWIGTQNGLARFDGLRFTTFDRASTGVDSTFVAQSLLDSKGGLWFGTPRGVLRWADERLQIVHSDPALLSVNALAESADGRLWLASDLGLYQIKDGRAELAEFDGQPCLSLTDTGAGGLLVGGVGQISRLRGAAIERWDLAQPQLRVQKLVDYEGALWLGTQDGVWRFDPVSGGLQRELEALRGQSIEAMRADRNAQLWVGATSGLLRRAPDAAVTLATAQDLVDRPWVHALYEDRQGDLWIGTQRESLIRLADSPVRWLGEQDGLQDSFVWSVLAAPDENLWVGTNTGLQRLDANGRLSLVMDGKLLPQENLYNLAAAEDGSLLIGTRGGLALRHPDGRVEVPAELNALAGEQINSIQAQDGQVWIGSLNGLYRWRGGKLEALGPPLGSADARIRSILPLGPDELLLGTEGGVRHWRDGQFQSLPWAAPLEGQFVSRLAWLQPGLLGLATLDSGLGLMRGEKLLLLEPKHGLPSRNGWTLDVVEGHVYVASIGGVYRLALDKLPDPLAPPAHLRIDAEQVIRGRGRTRSHRIGCCNGGADARSARLGSQMVYGSTAGLVVLDVAAINPEPMAPRAVIEQLHNAGNSFAPDLGAQLTLSAESRDVAIDYTGLNLRDPEQIEFRYRLSGYNDEWQEAGTRRTAFFTHLPPGAYRFEVVARHPFGDWGTQHSSLQFEIAPRWFEWRSLQASALLLAVSGLFGGWRWRVAVFRRRELALERAVAQRTAELAAANQRLLLANRTLAEESRTDSLTGLSNRRALQESEIQRQGVVAMLDLDHFKKVNDQYGHAVGDQVLMEFALLLRSETRPGDLLARWGGEEFVVLLARMRPHQAEGWAERVRLRVASHRFSMPDGGHLSLSVSIGLATQGDDWQEAQELADSAMYRAKRAGRNCVVSA